jgi:hypothetical protein
MSDRKLEMKLGSLPFNPISKRSFKMPYFHVVSYAHDTACGPDDIHYQLLKHLPESALQVLLDLRNDIWETGDLPSIWKLANVIPIPKPRTRSSNVLLPWRNPHCILDKSPLESRNYTRRALIISSNCRYIDNVLSLNKSRFVDYLHHGVES